MQSLHICLYAYIYRNSHTYICMYVHVCVYKHICSEKLTDRSRGHMDESKSSMYRATITGAECNKAPESQSHLHPQHIPGKKKDTIKLTETETST